MANPQSGELEYQLNRMDNYVRGKDIQPRWGNSNDPNYWLCKHLYYLSKRLDALEAEPTFTTSCTPQISDDEIKAVADLLSRNAHKTVLMPPRVTETTEAPKDNIVLRAYLRKKLGTLTEVLLNPGGDSCQPMRVMTLAEKIWLDCQKMTDDEWHAECLERIQSTQYDDMRVRAALNQLVKTMEGRRKRAQPAQTNPTEPGRS